MNQFAQKYNKFLYIFENIRSDHLGFTFSLFIHFFILLCTIGIPSFFDPKPIYVPTIIPIEIVNVSDITSIPKEIKDIKPSESKQVQIKEKKFNSSESQEIKKIDIKDKPKIENIEDDKKINIKENVQIKEKKTIPNEVLKKKIELETTNFESLPSEKIKPKLKPKIESTNVVDNKKTDVSIETKPKPKPEPEFDIASMLKDLRNEKTTSKIENENKEKEEDILKNENEKESPEKASELSISEIDLVVQQLSQCFIAPIGIKIEPSMFVKISVTIKQNRRVLENSVKVAATNIPKSNPIYGPVTESAMRTLLNPECSPLKLSEDKYELWKNLTIKFDYNMMKGN